MRLAFTKWGLVLIGFLISYTVAAQTRPVSGTVLDETTGSALDGATVTVKGTPNATQTNDVGEFTINVSATDVLVFSYAGYADKEIAVGEQANITVTLSSSAASKLDEVIVIGYGTAKRKEFAGAAGSVNANAFKHTPNTNVATALQGTVPGLRVQQSTGQPGATPNISFRGGTEFNGSGTPLFIVDGVIVPSLYGLNMNDVESIDVLKDAASTAIYGARAANGVVLVTTKKGKKGRAVVSYSIKQTNNYRRETMDYLTAAEYIHMNREGLRARYLLDSLDGRPRANDGFYVGNWGWGLNSGFTSPIGLYTTQLVTNNNRAFLNDPNWKLLVDPNPFNPDFKDSILYREITTSEREAMLFRNSNTTDHNISVSGANDQGAFALSLGAVKDNGTIIGSQLKRFTLNFNGGLNVGQRMKVLFNAGGYTVNVLSPYVNVSGGDNEIGLNNGGLLQRFLGVAPTVRYTDERTGAILPGPNDNTIGNPLYWRDIYVNNTNEQRFTSSLNIEYDILPFLKALVSGNGFFRFGNSNSFTKAYQQGNGGAMNTTRQMSFTNYKDVQYTYNGFLQFKKIFGVHDITALAGGEFQDRKRYDFSGSAQGAPTDIIPWLTGAGAPTVENGALKFPQYASSNFSGWERMASAIGRLNYILMNKYFLTGILRYDGTSRLGDNRYGIFPGVSLGWNLHSEDFYKNSALSNYISSVKPRISYGVNGNIDPLGLYATAQVYNDAGIYNGLGGVYAANYINPALRWERVSSSNFGLDLGFFNNRVTLIADYFIRNVFDKIRGLGISSQTGFTSYTTNLGQLQNRGFELSLTAKAIVPKTEGGVSLDLGANFYTVKNFVKKLPYNGLPGNRQGTYDPVWDPNNPGQLMYVGGLIEGKRVGLDEVWAPKWGGIYRTKAELDADANVSNAFLSLTNKKLKQLGDAKWHQVFQNDSIDSRQLVFVGRTTPSITGNFFVNVGYKGVSLYTAFDYALKFVVLNGEKVRGLSQVQGSQNSSKDVLDTWTPSNPNAPLPRFYWANQGRNFQTTANNSGFTPANLWERGDYLSMREITLSYSLGRNFLENTFRDKIKGFNVYVTGTNLIYFTKYSGYFPEMGGADNGRYPLPRTLTLGATITL